MLIKVGAMSLQLVEVKIGVNELATLTLVKVEPKLNAALMCSPTPSSNSPLPAGNVSTSTGTAKHTASKKG